MNKWPHIRDVLDDYYDFGDDQFRLDRAVSRCAVRFSKGLRVAPDDTIHPQDIVSFIRQIEASSGTFYVRRKKSRIDLASRMFDSISGEESQTATAGEGESTAIPHSGLGNTMPITEQPGVTEDRFDMLKRAYPCPMPQSIAPKPCRRCGHEHISAALISGEDKVCPECGCEGYIWEFDGPGWEHLR